VRARHVPLSTIKFNFTPEGLEQSIVEPKEINAKVVEDMFRRSYYRVYRAWPKQSVGNKWELILANARTSKLSLETFMVTVMLSWRITRPNTVFPVPMLAQPMAPDKVMDYARICRDTKGYTGADALGKLFDLDMSGLGEKLARSEMLYGQSIIGWKLFKGSLDFKAIYTNLELSLDPYWLAVEPTYMDCVITPYLQDSSKSSTLQCEIRSIVCQHIGMMKRNKRIASTVFSLRAKMMAEAVKSALEKWSKKPDDFTHANVTVTDPTKFWNALGLAVLHVECQRAVDSLPHKLWNHSC